jgi:2-polyprenyl-3-methyl-5-hydroxy-6-metoxy-1,4-benzoquinol methylase
LSEATTANPHQPLLRCAECQHVFVRPDFSDEQGNYQLQLASFNDDFASRKGAFQKLYEWINARRTHKALSLKRGSRILEVGPGTGFLMDRLSKAGYQLHGVDISLAVAQNIVRRRGLSITVDSLESHAQVVGAHSYDAIVMRHVLEHCTDPFQTLCTAFGVLRPGGILYVAVPNMDAWEACFAGWSGYERYHVHYFNRASLRIVARRAGFDIVSVDTYESPTGWVNTLLRTLKGRVTWEPALSPRRSGRRVILECARLVLGTALFPVRWLQAKLGRGEEVVVVAAKPLA